MNVNLCTFKALLASKCVHTAAMCCNTNDKPTPTSEAKHQMQCALLLDVVIREGPAVLQLLACENQALLVWRDALLVLDFGFHIVNSVRCLHVQCNCLACQGFHEDLHPPPQAKHQVQCALFLDVVIREGPAVLQLFACENQALLVWRDTLLVLDFCFHIVNRVGCFNIQCNCLACQGFHEDLHTPPQAKHQVQCALFLDVVIREGPAVLQLFACENQALLVWGDT